MYKNNQKCIFDTIGYKGIGKALSHQAEAGQIFWLEIEGRKNFTYFKRNKYFIRKIRKVRIYNAFMNNHKWDDNDAIYNSLKVEMARPVLDKKTIINLINKIKK